LTVAPFDPSADPAPLAALHAACFPDPWHAQALRELFAADAFAFHSADGFVLARVAGGEAEILTLAVNLPARGKGLGRALLQAAIRKARALGADTMFLEVGADNPAALALYAGLGFAKVGMRKAYYGANSRTGQDALVLRLSLGGDFA
jgi:ribosomal-protein-alanine N-acetyltransferase